MWKKRTRESQNVTKSSTRRAHNFICFPLTKEDSFSHYIHSRALTSFWFFWFFVFFPCVQGYLHVVMFVCILTAFLRALLTADKYGGCQNCSGTAKHHYRPPWFFPFWVTLPLRKWKTSIGVRQDTPPPLQKAGTHPITYLERVTIHSAVLWVHVAEAAMPTQRDLFTTAGEAFWLNCSGQRSVQKYLKWSKQVKANPFPSSLPWTTCQGGVLPARSPHPPWRMNQLLHASHPLGAPRLSGAALQQIASIYTQRGGAACSELTAFLLLVNISCFHFFTSTHRFQFSLPSVPSHCSCVFSLRWVSDRGGVTPLEQMSDICQDVLFGCQTSGTEGPGKVQQLMDLSFSRASGIASKEVREQETPLHSPDIGEIHRKREAWDMS